MANRIILTLFFCFAAQILVAQHSYLDSLKKDFAISENDTIKLVRLRNLTRIYSEINPDSAFSYSEKLLSLARELNFKLDEANALREMGYALTNMGNYPRSLQTILSAIKIAEDPKSEQKILTGNYNEDALVNRNENATNQRLSELAFIYDILGILYSNTNNYDKALMQYLKARQIAEQSGNVPLQSIINLTLSRAYLNLKKSDSALISLEKAYEQSIKVDYTRYLGSILLNMGIIYASQGNKLLGVEYYKKALIASAYKNYYPRGVVAGNLRLADYYKQSGKQDSSFLYIKDALVVAHDLNAPELLRRSYTALADYYKTIGNNDSAVKYQSLIIKINDNLFNSKQVQQFQNIDYDARQKQQEIEIAKKDYRDSFQKYLLLGGLAAVLFAAVCLWRTNWHRKKSNAMLQHQNKEIESALSNLKATQAQLIQSEKMASLGELTAGIAHEIQNPLNFVNNFSEVNKELIEELKSEMSKVKSERDDAIEEALLNDLAENEKKINHHGKRAENIVKGMLQHSRSNTATKEPTDINKLADEYLRLAYHGLRAKDKNFNALLKTDFDDSIGKILIQPQDIGRVILNLITNAFYAVDEKMKSPHLRRLAEGIEPYEPTVTVTTRRLSSPPAGGAGGLEIRVSDNGNGIPQKILDKIFQPFFTTKPAGQGTGLGLSLSYDIIKAHGGEIKVETKEGEGTEFIILL